MSIIRKQAATKLYKQEGKTGTYQSMLWALAVQDAAHSTVPVSWGEYFVYFKNNYLGVYWDEVGFEKVTAHVIKEAPQGLPSTWQRAWADIDQRLTDASREMVAVDVSALSLEELRTKYDRLYALDLEMWRTAIFIDTFDPGFDQTEIQRVASKHGLSDEEVQTLVTPTVPAYVTEWNTALRTLSKGELCARFFWYATDYWLFGEVTDEFIASESSKAHDEIFVSPVAEQERILKKYDLSENPLLTFQTLTTWRDIRKRLNYTGLYGLIKILREVLRRQRIDQSLVNGLLPHQVPDLFAGTLTETVIRSQFSEGVLFHVSADWESEFLYGADAAESWRLLDEDAKHEAPYELRGVVASRGKVKGRVCVVPHITNQNAGLMQSGDILVTSMTRPEFVPLMRLAGAIVTNEGGITSHAAIVSRELGKPCIIGTKNATRVLVTGDMVEVDAEAGVVKILEKKVD